jgi:hypothetical protein
VLFQERKDGAGILFICPRFIKIFVPADEMIVALADKGFLTGLFLFTRLIVRLPIAVSFSSPTPPIVLIKYYHYHTFTSTN